MTTTSRHCRIIRLLAVVWTLGCSDPAPTAQLSKTGGTGEDVDTLVGGSDADDGKTTADSADSADEQDAAADTVGACVVSADCPGEKDLCIAGVCQSQTTCASDKQCQAAGLVCDMVAGVCVQCLTGDDCGTGESCKAHKCLPPPTKCASTKDCALGLVCDKPNKVCVECITSDDCSKGLTCSETVCVPMLCQPGTTSCADQKSVKTCTSDGMGYEQTDCPGGSMCVG
ncbi:MAG: hypothetical protein HY902_20295, partial [Deltaproteobacteria bacterium]|nr:hypothetical protein [Deltaproteobacteria bacterium]